MEAQVAPALDFSEEEDASQNVPPNPPRTPPPRIVTATASDTKEEGSQRRKSIDELLRSPTGALATLAISLPEHQTTAVDTDVKEEDKKIQAVANKLATHDVLDAYQEHLGDDFRNTPWKKPSRALARQHAADQVYGDGQANFRQVDDTELFIMGEGVGLYFIWLKYLVAFGAVASILHLPAMLIGVFGEGFGRDELDPFKLSFASSGNHRDVTSDDNTVDLTQMQQRCAEKDVTTVDTIFMSNVSCDSWFFSLWSGTKGLLTAKHGSYLIVACDIACCILFIMLYKVYQKNIDKYKRQADDENVTVADYSVFVKGLPEDAEEEDVIAHFSQLFRLDKESWSSPGGVYGRGKKVADKPEDIKDVCGNCIADTMHPVESTAHSQFDHLCLNTWVAEVAIAHPERKFIMTARSMQSMSNTILQVRAAVKKYSKGSPYANETQLKIAEAKLSKLMSLLDKKAEKLEQQAAVFESISWKCYGAFVIFNHEESYVRCLNDYSTFKGLVQPKELRFKGTHILDVQCAQEPGNILWENLEISRRSSRFRMFMTFLVTIGLLVASFVLASVSAAAKDVYDKAMPSDDVCFKRVPVAYSLEPTQVRYVAYNDKKLSELGIESCPADTTYITIEGLAAPTDPSTDDPCYQPCVSPKAQKQEKCIEHSYTTKDINNCFCRQEIQEAVLKYGTLSGGKYILDNYSTACAYAGAQYIKGQVMTLVATAVVLVVNTLVKEALNVMTEFEAHDTITGATLSKAGKLTIALFVNTLIVTLIVNAYIKARIPLLYNEAGAKGFNFQWYRTAGASLIVIMAVNIFSPHGGAIADYLVISPLRKLMAWFSITQGQMNKAYEGPRFDLSVRLPFVLNTLAITMVLSPALPLLIPIATAAFTVTYLVDKYLLVKHFTKPPQYDTQLAFWMNSRMPLVLFLHCAFAVWVYAEKTVFASGYIFLSSGPAKALEIQNYMLNLKEKDPTGFIWRSFHITCFPFTILMVVIAIIAATRVFAVTAPTYYIWIRDIARMIIRAPSIGAEYVSHDFNPEFTGVFKRVFPVGTHAPEQFKENWKEGWYITKDATGAEVLTKLHDDDGTGFASLPGSPKSRTGKMKVTAAELPPKREMLTWEVLKDLYGVATYHMVDNKAYAGIVLTQNMLVKELAINTPKCPGGKLWSPEGYRNHQALKATIKGKSGTTPVVTPKSTMPQGTPGLNVIAEPSHNESSADDTTGGLNNSMHLRAPGSPRIPRALRKAHTAKVAPEGL